MRKFLVATHYILNKQTWKKQVKNTYKKLLEDIYTINALNKVVVKEIKPLEVTIEKKFMDPIISAIKPAKSKFLLTK